MNLSKLSFAQKRLWLHNMLLPHGAVYNLARVMRLRGVLDVNALRQALNDVVSRHEGLRSHLVMANGEPMMAVLTELDLALEVECLVGLPAVERIDGARRRVLEEARTPFDLERGPLVRARLLNVEEQEHLLLVTFHHIACDDWSMRVFWGEVATQYVARRQSTPSPLAGLPMRYADYARQQRESLRGEMLERQLAYWKQALFDLATLELPTDRARPPQPNHLGQQFVFTLGEGLTSSLRSLAHREGATFFTTLIAALQVLLYRYSGCEDVAVGVPVAGRGRPEVEGLIGFFVNTLVIRGDLSGKPTFTDYLRRVRHTTQQAYAHQDIPFDILVEKLRPKRASTRNPLFQVMLTQWNPEGQTLRLAGLQPADVDSTDTGTAKFDLEFVVVERQGRCRITIEYATELFDIQTIERMADHFTKLLEAIVADPQQRVGDLQLLSSTERHRLLAEWNDTMEAVPEGTLAELFEAQVARTPEATALVFEQESLTYAELNRRANQLAHVLMVRGIGPEDLVALAVPRSVELIVALLGILKTGAAYVPLDPDYPAERLAFMLEDAAPRLLVTVQALRAQLPGVGARLILDEAGTLAALAGSAPDNPTDKQRTRPLQPLHPAYIIYTSGSTGKPKGCMVTHQSVVNFFEGMDALLGDSDGVWLAVTSVCFDISVLELLWTLCREFEVVLFSSDPKYEQTDTASVFAEKIVEHGVTHFQCTPSLVQALIHNEDVRNALQGIRFFLVGGEPLPRSLADQLTAAVGGVVINMYGPTETAVWSSTANTSICEDASGVVAIGRPISNTQIYVLDGHFEPVPIGVSGELYIAGAGLARGYWQRASLTANRFVANPFQNNGGRMYRTGDVARWTRNGFLQFLGRSDDQVKIRGFRIELGEIEAVLRRHGQVQQAVVVVRELNGEKTLCAHYVEREKGLSVAVLREYLRAKLPEHMVPAFLVKLPAFPLTPNGKVDRNALAKLRLAELPVSSEYVPPYSDRERTIVDLWQALLGRKLIGVHDNFFDLGGHSLLAIKFMLLLRERTGAELPVRMLFESPTAAALAARCTVKEESSSAGRAGAGWRVPGQPSPIHDILCKQLDFVSPWKGTRSSSESFIVTLNDSGRQQGLFWCLQGFRELTQLAMHLGSGQPVHGMRSGYLVMEYTEENVHALASHYAAEMIGLQPDGPFWLGGNCQGGTVALAVAQRLRELGRVVSLLILMEQDSFRPYDGPVALIFGRDSHFNPYKSNADPDIIFRNSYPAGFTVDIIAGAHGKFFELPNVETLASAVRRRISARTLKI